MGVLSHGVRNAGRRRIIARHAGEALPVETCLKILKILWENRERGIVRGEGVCSKPDRNICKNQQG